MMDDTQSTTQAFGSNATFDPLAFAPAFARKPSSNVPPTEPQHPAQASASASSASDSARTRFSVPELGDASLMGELPTTDPLSILLQKHLPPHVRPPRDLSGIWHTSSGPTTTEINAPSNEIPDPFAPGNDPEVETINADTVRQAAASNSWRKIASLARSKLEAYSNVERQRLVQQQQQLVDAPPTHDQEMDVRQVLEWWSIRLYALARLKLYSMLRTELSALWQVLSTTRVHEGSQVVLADTEDVPFTLRVLKATEPKYRGEVRTTLEQYTLLIQLCKRNMRRSKAFARATAKDGDGGVEGEVRKWRGRAERVGLMLAFTLSEAKDYAGAIEVMTPLVESSLRLDEARASDVEGHIQLVAVASRLWIQAGDLSFASTLLDRAEALLPTPIPPTLTAQLNHTRSLIHAISGDFSAASSLLPSNPSTPAEHLNAAIITFYSAHLDASLSQLEQLLSSHPHAIASADAVVFNLATLYELGQGSESQAVAKKRELLDKVAKFAGEPGVSGSSFKL